MASTGATALDRLREGNARYASGSSVLTNKHVDLSEGQRPWAIVLACADSRVPVEAIFDQGPGELFVVRVAGNLAGPDQLGSIEFAALEFGSPLILVLGHTQCGAVTAARNGAPEATPALRGILDAIAPGIADAASIEAAIEANARTIATRLPGASQALTGLVEAGAIRIVAAVYDLATGRVEFFD